ncbi:MAG: GNAT family N-acetyltransferase, partial [Pseudomonadota bacterium]
MNISLRAYRDADFDVVHHMINNAAEAYRGKIPADCWHEPYMSAAELRAEIADGVSFSLAEASGQPLAVMGIQDRREVLLIRHAYVLPAFQGQGVGDRLLEHHRQCSELPYLIGTWRAAQWAI